MSVPTASPPASRRGGWVDAFQGPYLWPSITALAAISIGSVDQYVVNTSMPRVLAELGQPVFYAWVASAFVLAQIVGMSLAGAWRDRSGLRLPFLATIAVFGVGSMLCAIAPSMFSLVLARGFQGLGAGGLGALSYATVAHYPEALRIRMYSAISTLWGIVALCGPLLGGAITDLAGWRWIFLANAPLCIIAAGIALRGLSGTTTVPRDRGRAIPFARSALLALTVGCLVAAPSSEPIQAIALVAAGLALGWVYLCQERKAAAPVIPLGTWTGRGAVGSCMLATMCITGAYIGAGVFLPLYLQLVRHESAVTAGTVLSCAGVSWTIGSFVGLKFEGGSRLPATRFAALMITVGALSVALQDAFGDLPLLFIYVSWSCAAIGVGIALLHLMNWVVVYSPREQSGAASAAVQTARLLGSAAVGALLGAVLHAIGADPEHLRSAIAAVFALGALVALMPATLLRPKLDAAAAAEPAHEQMLAAVEA